MNEEQPKPTAQSRYTPVPRQDHDLLIFPHSTVAAATECYRVPVNRDSAPDEHPPGSYTQPPRLQRLTDKGQRKALSVMHPELFDDRGLPGEGVAKPARGPAFAVAPVKADPAPVSFCTCFLVNAAYFTEPNLWTQEEWVDSPNGPDYPPLLHPEQVEMLIAVPWGEVVKLRLRRELFEDDGWRRTQIGGGDQGELERVDLKREPEVWSQLRNGCIAGRSWFEAEGRAIPLVNITALIQEPGDDRRRTERGC